MEGRTERGCMMAEFLVADVLGGCDGVAHGFFTRRGGVSEGIYASLNVGLGSKDERARVLENRRRAVAALGGEKLATVYQEHTGICHVIADADDWAFDAPPVGDALATNVPGLVIGVVTADCGPVLFADAQAGVIGAAHAGWRGAVGGVLEATLKAMESLGADRGRIQVALGPTISRENYEVDDAFRARLIEMEAGNARFFKASRPGHHLFDLPGYIVARLRAAGVGAAQDLKRCTYADPESFFSYRWMRREKLPDYGRQLSAIVLSQQGGA